MELAEIKKQLEHIKTYPAAITHCNGVDMAYFVPTQIAELVAAVESLTAEKEQMKHERDCLAQGIGDAVTRAGITEGMALTGPELLMLLSDLGDSLAQAREEIASLGKTAAEPYNKAYIAENRAEAAEQREKGLVEALEKIAKVDTGEWYDQAKDQFIYCDKCQDREYEAKAALAAASKEEA